MCEWRFPMFQHAHSGLTGTSTHAWSHLQAIERLRCLTRGDGVKRCELVHFLTYDYSCCPDPNLISFRTHEGGHVLVQPCLSAIGSPQHAQYRPTGSMRDTVHSSGTDRCATLNLFKVNISTIYMYTSACSWRWLIANRGRYSQDFGSWIASLEYRHLSWTPSVRVKRLLHRHHHVCIQILCYVP